MPGIICKGVTKIYRIKEVETHALRGVDLELTKGEFTALAGPSGSGKTTLLNVLGGIDSPTQGTVHMDGTEITAMSRSKLSDLRLKKLGFVFQAYNLIPVLSAVENVEFVLLLQGVPLKERRERAQSLLSEMGLAEIMDKKPLEMSGGQQQRVAVARSIAHDPEVVLADEPTANLDSTTAESLLRLMRGLNRDKGITFLFSTHDQRVMDHASRLVQIRDGKIFSDEKRE